MVLMEITYVESAREAFQPLWKDFAIGIAAQLDEQAREEESSADDDQLFDEDGNAV